MDKLIGQTVKEVRPMTKAELKAEYWEPRHGRPPICIVFSDGTKLYPSKDSEGNGPGAMFGVDGESGKTILIG